ncbi:MAG TPA: nucleotide exchange factor GrpE [Pyrinomonadaceae bacterium]|jgi:molecular chaperone GrpE (heat shock protein)
MSITNDFDQVGEVEFIEKTKGNSNLLEDVSSQNIEGMKIHPEVDLPEIRIADVSILPTENQSFDSLEKRLIELMGLVEESNRIANERERIIDRLHQENQQLKQGELEQAIMPVWRDLIRLFDDLKQTANRYVEREELQKQSIVKDFECYRDIVEDILYRYGVERYTAESGVPFNSKEHKALGVVETSESVNDKTLARVLRDGFKTENRNIRFLEVEVFRFNSISQEQNQENTAFVPDVSDDTEK